MLSDISYEPSLPPLSALSPSSFLFPSSDSGYVSLYSSAASLSSRTSVGFVSSASSSLYTSSFTPLSSLPLPPRPSVLSPAAGVSAPPPPPGFPPLPHGFPPLSFSPLLSRLLFLFLLSRWLLPPFLLWFILFLPLLLQLCPLRSSSSPSSSLDYASYKAHVLAISDEYLSLARWYN